LRKGLRKDERGFFFSLDATLSLLVVLIVLAGVAHVGELGAIYEQHGYLRLERYANDTLESMLLTGSLDNIVDLIVKGDNAGAMDLARIELRKALPQGVQFKLMIGDNFEVYPSASQSWKSVFENAQELAVSTKVTGRFKKATTAWILAWLDDNADDSFMTAVENFARNTGADWHVTRVYTKEDFQRELQRPRPRPPWQYDVVFMPDVEVQFDDRRLIDYVRRGGKLVVGGKTLWYNRNKELWEEVLGVEWTGRPPLELIGEPEYDKMKIIDDTHYITLPYVSGDRIRYSGENYAQYVYTPRTDRQVQVRVLAEWDNKPENVTVSPFPWPGIIFSGAHGRFSGSSVLFNMRLAQSAMNPPYAGRDDWVQLAARAIGYLGTSEFKSVRLYVWRGPEVS
jgi:hypothetical protein